jgi:hypothetical protein
MAGYLLSVLPYLFRYSGQASGKDHRKIKYHEKKNRNHSIRSYYK